MARRRGRKNGKANVQKKKVERPATNCVNCVTVLTSGYLLETIRPMLISHEMHNLLLSCQRLAGLASAFLRFRICREEAVPGIIPTGNYVALYVERGSTFHPASHFPALQELHYCMEPQSHNDTFVHFPRLRNLSLTLFAFQFSPIFALPTTLTSLCLKQAASSYWGKDHFLNFQKALPSSLLDMRLTGTFDVDRFVLPSQLDRFELKIVRRSKFQIALPFPQQLRVLKMHSWSHPHSLKIFGPGNTSLPLTLEKLCCNVLEHESIPCVSRLTNLRVLKAPNAVITTPLPRSLRTLECKEFLGPPASLNFIASLSFAGTRWCPPRADILPELTSLTELILGTVIEHDHVCQIPPTVETLSLPNLHYLSTKSCCAESLPALKHLHLLYSNIGPMCPAVFSAQLMKISFAQPLESRHVLVFCRSLNMSVIERIFVHRVPNAAFLLKVCIERSTVGQIWDRLTYVCGICRHATFLSPKDDVVLAISNTSCLACSSCTARKKNK